MAGYCGYSMSNNAVEAYEYGAMPLSKWTKDVLLDRIREELNYNFDNEELTNSSIDKLAKYPLAILKDTFLQYDSWHHTGSYYNETEFYTVEIPDDFDIDKICKELEEKKEQRRVANRKNKSESVTFKYVEFEYLEWYYGYYKQKPIKRYAMGIMVGNWIYYKGYGVQKKNINTNGCYILKQGDNLRGNLFNDEQKEKLREIKKAINKSVLSPKKTRSHHEKSL